MRAISRLQKLGTDLRIISSGRSFQTACTAAFGSAVLCGFGFTLQKLTKIIYYFSVLHVNKMLRHNDLPTKVAVTACVSL